MINLQPGLGLWDEQLPGFILVSTVLLQFLALSPGPPSGPGLRELAPDLPTYWQTAEDRQVVAKAPPPCHGKGLIHSTMFDLGILLTTPHEYMINRRGASWAFEGVCMVVGTNRGKRVLAAELSKFPSVLRLGRLSMKVSVEVSGNYKNIPDRKMCEDGVQ